MQKGCGSWRGEVMRRTEIDLNDGRVDTRGLAFVHTQHLARRAERTPQRDSDRTVHAIVL